MENEMISIIVPVYNAEMYLEKCISSILAQTYTNFEVLLIDDGSTDRSFSICKKFCEKDARIKVYHIDNTGVSNARNMGIHFATGQYLLFVDADDFIHQEMLFKLADSMDNTISISMCNFFCVDEFDKVLDLNNEKLISKCVDSRREYIEVLQTNWSPWGKLYKKELLDNIKFDVQIAIAEDLLFNVEIVCKNDNFKVNIIEDRLYYYRQNIAGAMHQSYSNKHFIALQTEYKVYKVLTGLGLGGRVYKIFFSGLRMFYARLAKCSVKEFLKHITEYRSSRELIKNEKPYLLMKNKKRSISEQIIMYCLVYAPVLYFIFMKLKYMRIRLD